MTRPHNPAHVPHQLGQPRGLASDTAPERRASPASWQTAIGIDLSYSGKGDRAAIVVVSRRSDEPTERARYYVRDVWSGAKEIRSLRGTLAAWGARYEGAPMASYVGASELGVLQLLGSAAVDPDGTRQPAVNIVPMLATSGKTVRSVYTQDLWNAGRVILPRASWAEPFARKVLAFTGIDGDQDDEVDALVSAIEFLRVCGGPAGGKMSARRTRF